MIEYVGETCSDKEIQGDCSQKYTDGTTYLYSILVQNEEHMNAIDATCYGNASSFINCCCKPDFGPAKVLIDSQNLSLQHLALFAIEPIASGEELAFNCNVRIHDTGGAKKKTFCMCDVCMEKRREANQDYKVYF